MLRNKSAFTQVELTVVIAIIAILAAISVGGFIFWLPKYRLSSAANELQAMIQTARLRAVKDNARVVVLFDPNADGELDGDYMAFMDDEAGGAGEWTRQPATEPLVKMGQLPSGVRFENTTFANNRFRYSSRGFLVGINGSINLKNTRNAAKRITVYVSGNSRVF
jgi:prepilin-type N-terminal cleavage/methylation domain-containing protein